MSSSAWAWTLRFACDAREAGRNRRPKGCAQHIPVSLAATELVSSCQIRSRAPLPRTAVVLTVSPGRSSDSVDIVGRAARM